MLIPIIDYVDPSMYSYYDYRDCGIHRYCHIHTARSNQDCGIHGNSYGYGYDNCYYYRYGYSTMLNVDDCNIGTVIESPLCFISRVFLSYV